MVGDKKPKKSELLDQAIGFVFGLPYFFLQ
jgi:hypothetical protein